MLWNAKYELTEYWDKVYSDPKKMKAHCDEFKKELKKLKHIPPRHSVADIGGGGFGGVFNVYSGNFEKFLIDPLGHTYAERYKMIPEDVTILDDYSYNISLDDNSVNMVFCINTLDHCNSVQEFETSFDEIGRILFNGGIFYGTLHLRHEEIEGHPIHLGNMNSDRVSHLLCTRMEGMYLSKKRVRSGEKLYFCGIKNE